MSLIVGGSHHKKVSVILTSQNLLQKAKHQVTISRNLTHFILTCDKRSKGQLKWLGQQINPSDGNELLRNYERAMDDGPLSYLVVSFHPSDHFQYFNGIFKGEHKAIYLTKR